MHKYIMKLLQCPVCKNELSWNIVKENETRIIEGTAECINCFNKYPIIDTVGLFIEPKLQKFSMWNRNEKRINDSLKNKLMNSDNRELSPMELMLKGEIFFNEGQIELADNFYQSAYKKVGSVESREAIARQINFMINKINNNNDFIVDIASGRCIFVTALLKKMKIKSIVTDINPIVLINNRKKFIASGIDDYISQIALDVKKMPFKNDSIKIMTSYTGLQNIFHFGDTLKELNRVNNKFFYSANFFIPDKYDENYQEVERSGNKQMWLKKLFLQEFKDLKWNTWFENSEFVSAKAIKRGKVIQWMETNFLPVVNTEYEYCISVSEKK